MEKPIDPTDAEAALADVQNSSFSNELTTANGHRRRRRKAVVAPAFPQDESIGGAQSCHNLNFVIGMRDDEIGAGLADVLSVPAIFDDRDRYDGAMRPVKAHLAQRYASLLKIGAVHHHQIELLRPSCEASQPVECVAVNEIVWIGGEPVQLVVAPPPLQIGSRDVEVDHAASASESGAYPQRARVREEVEDTETARNEPQPVSNVAHIQKQPYGQARGRADLVANAELRHHVDVYTGSPERLVRRQQLPLLR